MQMWLQHEAEDTEDNRNKITFRRSGQPQNDERVSSGRTKEINSKFPGFLCYNQAWQVLTFFKSNLTWNVDSVPTVINQF